MSDVYIKEGVYKLYTLFLIKVIKDTRCRLVGKGGGRGFPISDFGFRISGFPISLFPDFGFLYLLKLITSGVHSPSSKRKSNKSN